MILSDFTRELGFLAPLTQLAAPDRERTLPADNPLTPTSPMLWWRLRARFPWPGGVNSWAACGWPFMVWNERTLRKLLPAR